MLFDQNVKVNHAVFSEFFGIEAATTKSVAIVALRTGAPILLSTCAIIGRNKYKLYAFKIHNPIDEEGTQQQKISSITRELHQRVEEVIRLHPEQWMWIHRRYKTRPPGEKENLYDLDSQIYNHRTTVKN